MIIVISSQYGRSWECFGIIKCGLLNQEFITLNVETLTIIPDDSGTESADGSDEEMADEYNEGRVSKKKEKKRQEREAQRQVTYVKF